MELFSCRNCVQNPMQGVSFGAGQGYCLQWGTVLEEPSRATCKYLHRKDLPRHLVDEALREHAHDFAHVAGPADLLSAERLLRKPYSEKSRWDTGTFDPAVQAMAVYHRSDSATEEGGKVRYLQAFVGSAEGRRALAYSSLWRRYMHHCDSWTSSYRLVLAQLEELGDDVYIPASQLVAGADAEDARWELLYAQASAVQEFGWHASLEPLLHPLSSALEAVAEQDWGATQRALRAQRGAWRALVIQKARDEGEYFPQAAGQ